MNKNLFNTVKTPASTPPANAVNHAGGNAYYHGDEHALAQLAMTGMFGDTYYEDAETQLNKVLELSRKVDPVFVAQVAMYARQHGFMKDMPAVLAAVLTTRGAEGLVLLRKIFPVVIDNGKMLSTFIQIMRSGKVGRKSMGSSVKKTVQLWFDTRSDFQLFRDSVGMTPSLSDIIKMVHPRPSNATRQALYGYLIGKNLTSEQFEVLPEFVTEYELFKSNRLGTAGKSFTDKPSKMGKIPAKIEDLKVPNVPFQMLTSLNLTNEDWKAIARNGNWHFTRMNLNTFARHGVFPDPEMVQIVADKLRDRESILKNKVMPFQLLVAYKNVEPGVPTEINNALHDAVEIAVENVPTFGPGGVAVMVDVSGSMKLGRVGGNRPDGKPNNVRCIDVAGLFASAILRKNPNAIVIPFEGGVRMENKLTSRDSILTNTEKLAMLGGGSTACSTALAYMNQNGLKANTVIYLSDNESWVDAKPMYRYHNGTATMEQWRIFKVKNPKAKMINIDMTPNTTSQASNDDDIMNIGGFTDKIFTTVKDFVDGNSESQQWVPAIKAMAL